MKKMLTKENAIKIFWALFALSIFSISAVYAINTWNTWYRINNGASANVYVAWTSNYRVVTNTSWKNVFVPSKTTSEMNSYCSSPWAACYTCSLWWWLNDWYRSNTIDHDTGAGSVWHTQAWCLNWCRGILDWAKDAWQHWCVRRSNGRCHLYRDDVSATWYESGRSRQRIDCSNT